MRTWPEDDLSAALRLAGENGRAVVTLESPDLAKRFRLALYAFRRREGVGLDLELILSGTDVILLKPTAPKITIFAPSAPPEAAQ